MHAAMSSSEPDQRGILSSFLVETIAKKGSVPKWPDSNILWALWRPCLGIQVLILKPLNSYHGQITPVLLLLCVSTAGRSKRQAKSKAASAAHVASSLWGSRIEDTELLLLTLDNAAQVSLFDALLFPCFWVSLLFPVNKFKSTIFVTMLLTVFLCRSHCLTDHTREQLILTRACETDTGKQILT